MFELYADYIKERLGRGSFHDEDGFVIFEFIDNGITYLVDMYVRPDARKKGIGKRYLEKLKEISRENGKNKIITTIALKAKTKDVAIMAALKGGFSIVEAKNDVLVLSQEI